MAELAVLVIEQGEKLAAILEYWRTLGIVQVTVFDSVGMPQVKERMWMDDLPLFPSLENLLRGEGSAQKTAFAVIREPELMERMIAGTKELLGNLDEPGEGLLYTIPVTRIIGIR